MRQVWNGPWGPLVTASAQLATFTTLADVPLVPQITLPANILDIGTLIRISAEGNWSSTGTPTFQWGFYYGGVAGVALAAGPAATTASGAASNPWMMEYWGRVRTLGTSGSIVGQGIQRNPTSLTAWSIIPVPVTAAARTVTIDTTTAKTITVGAACSASSGSNIFVVDNLMVEILN